VYQLFGLLPTGFVRRNLLIHKCCPSSLLSQATTSMFNPRSRAQEDDDYNFDIPAQGKSSRGTTGRQASSDSYSSRSVSSASKGGRSVGGGSTAEASGGGTDAMEKAAKYLSKYGKGGGSAAKSPAPAPASRPPARRRYDDEEDSLDFDEDEIDVSLSSGEGGGRSRGSKTSGRSGRSDKPSMAQTSFPNQGGRAKVDQPARAPPTSTAAPEPPSPAHGGDRSFADMYAGLMSIGELEDQEEAARAREASMGSTFKGRLSSSATGVVKSATDIPGIRTSSTDSWRPSAMVPRLEESHETVSDDDDLGSSRQHKPPSPPSPGGGGKRFLTIADLSSILADDAAMVEDTVRYTDPIEEEEEEEHDEAEEEERSYRAYGDEDVVDEASYSHRPGTSGYEESKSFKPGAQVCRSYTIHDRVLSLRHNGPRTAMILP
jgi:hypothetical protein